MACDKKLQVLMCLMGEIGLLSAVASDSSRWARLKQPFALGKADKHSGGSIMQLRLPLLRRLYTQPYKYYRNGAPAKSKMLV